MLRMFIDNEEVVSNNDFTIKEEMLNPSSTILNNVYPKLWEETHDYTSMFYYPKDYSKLRIEDFEVVLPPSTGETIEGTNLQFTYDNRREFNYGIKGDTYQYSTTGQQLYNVKDVLSFDSIVSVDDDDWITITYNNSSGTSTKWYEFKTNTSNLVQISTSYKLVVEIKSVSGTGSINFAIVQPISQTNTTYYSTFSTLTTGTKVQTITMKSDFTDCTTLLNSYGKFNAGESGSITFRLSVVPNNTDTTNFVYQKFTGGQPSPSPTYPQPIQVVSGRQEIDVCGKNLAQHISGYVNNSGVFKTSGDDSFYFYVVQGETYTYNTSGNRTIGAIFKNIPANNDTCISGTYNGSFRKNTPFVASATGYMVVYANTPTSQTVINDFIAVKGSTIGDYEPYIGQSYEVNLGKNLLDIPDKTSTNNGVSLNATNGVITLNNTATANSFFNLFSTNSSLVLEPGTYTLSANNNVGVAGSSMRIMKSDGSTIVDNTGCSMGSANGTKTFTITERVVGFLQARTSSGVSYSDFTFKPQLEKGPQATPYSPYFTPIELCKINTYQDEIFQNTNLLNTLDYSQNIDTSVSNNKIEINTTGDMVGVAYTFPLTQGKPYHFECDLDVGGHGVVVGIWREGGHNYTDEWIQADGHFSYDFTPDTASTQIMFFTEEEMVSSATITNVYLGRGTEYIPYNEKGDWYLYKEIGKVVLNGSEGWTVAGTDNYQAGLYNLNINTTIDIATNNSLCSHYGVFNRYVNVANSYAISNDMIRLRNENGLTQANWKTWLSSNNVSIYYPLSTPTLEKITNNELLEDLNQVDLLNGLNNLTITSSNLPGILNLHYNYNNEIDDINLIFSGIVKNTNNISLNPRYPKYCSLEVLDYKTLLSEGDTLDFVITNKTITEAITMVVNAVGKYGFELGNVNILNGDDVIGTYSTDNKTAYDVLQYLADISGAKWTCRVKDDSSMYIDFYDPTLLPKGKQIEYTNEWWCENDVIDLTFNYGTRDYRNKQIINSSEVYADIEYTENKVADSYTREFILANPIGKINSITVNGEEVSVATDTEKDIGIYADFYYQVGDNTIQSNGNNKPYAFGNVIEVKYIPIIKGREVVSNEDEIERVGNQLEVNGTISRYEDRNDETDTNKLLAIAETYLKYKGEAEITLTIKTKKNLYEVGQMVHFNAPISDLMKDYMVKSKEINIINNGADRTIFYTYELSSSFNSERAVNWFDNQRNKNSGNIKDGEFINRNIDISSTANIIWESLTMTSLSGITGDNELDATLNAPFKE